MSGFVVLEDGEVFAGESVGAEGTAFGEAVFTTSMSGYQEVATDPSFEGQLVCFTAPMVGNYGTAETRSESHRTHAPAVLMRAAPTGRPGYARTPSSRSPASTRARSCCTCASRARCAARS